MTGFGKGWRSFAAACQGVLLSLVTVQAVAGIDASSAMRIEVEVYQGPLSKETTVQAYELIGKVEEAKRSFGILQRNTKISMARLGCGVKLGGVDIDLDAPKFKAHAICPLLQEVYIDAKLATDKARKLVQDVDSNQDFLPGVKALNGSAEFEFKTENYKAQFDAVNAAARYGEWLRSRAAFWAGTHAAVWPQSKRVRIDTANFAQFAADYGNQITSRADALMKQVMGMERTEVLRDQLSSGIYLRDSATTRYLNLYDWNEASVIRGHMSDTDRVRMVEQLVNDTHWARINTVYASGQGNVQMAFVKDDIGNWNLKSFDSNPTELLETYRDLGSAAVVGATQLIKKVSTGQGGVSAARSMLGFANQVALGADPEATGTRGNLTQYRERLKSRLDAIARSHDSEDDAIATRLTEKEGEKNTREEQRDALKAEIETLRQQLKDMSNAPMDAGTPAPPAPEPATPGPVTPPVAETVPARSAYDVLLETLIDREKTLQSTHDTISALDIEIASLRGRKEQLPQLTRQRLRDALAQYRETLVIVASTPTENPSDDTTTPSVDDALVDTDQGG